MMERVEPVGRGKVWKMGEDERKMGGKGQLPGLLCQGKGGLLQEPKSQAKGEGFWRLQQGKKKAGSLWFGREPGERRPSVSLWFVLQKSGERDSVCREMGRREKTPKAERGSLVFSKGGSANLVFKGWRLLPLSV
jgi:hypothetical protein